jgi:selenocysteine-specific elongation factor
LAERPTAPARPALTVGTAGHIDHGKTALVRALTGTDTDRLAEEKRRGISIELGFTELALDDGWRLGMIDVPGHERLVRTMVAGASAIDLFLLVVAADDGVMPQTREHLAVLRALGVEQGVVAISKLDVAEPEARELARAEVAELLPAAPTVEVSARTGEGLDRLRAELGRLALGATRSAEDRRGGPAIRRSPSTGAGERRGRLTRPAALHVDRAFTIKGAGTVLTGTLAAGRIARGDRLCVLPGGVTARARSIEVHGRERELAVAGERVAINLAGVQRSTVTRGDVVAAPGCGLRASYRLDVQLDAAALRHDLDRRRVQVHHGTRDSPGRVIAISEDGLAQLRLESPLLAAAEDRFVIRRIAPPDTLGGGHVLDPAPARHGPAASARLATIRERGLAEALADERATEAVGERAGEAVGRPDPQSLDREASLVLAILARDGVEPRSPAAIAAVLRIDPPRVRLALARCVAAGRAARAAADVFYEAGELAGLRTRAMALARERGELSIASLRDALGTSRKYAQALLEHLDAEKLTVRHGDRHLPRRPAD